MEFKQLDIEPEESWVKRKIWSRHAKKTFIYIALGAVAQGKLILLYLKLSGDSLHSTQL